MAKVTIKDATHEFAKPTPGGAGTLESCETGTARIIWKAGNSGEQWCILQLGAGGAEVYDGPFAITYNGETKKIDIAQGFINRNGEWKKVSEASIQPSKTGYVCVSTKLNDSGEWSEPEFVITDPDEKNYPIGYCQVSGDLVNVKSYRVPVAIFMIAGDCEDE